MVETKILLSVLWICLMLVYLLGDVIRIFAGDFKSGEIEGKKVTQLMWMVVSIIMLIPILMIFFSLVLPYDISRVLNIVVPIGLFLFNLSGLVTYPGWYDRFLILVGLVFNVVTVIYAINWVG